MIIHSLVILLLGLYFVATGSFLVRILLRREGPSRISEPTLRVAFLLHSVAVIVFILDGRLVNVSSGADLVFYLSWILPGVYLASSRKMHYPILAAFVAGVAGVLLASSSFLAHGEVTQRDGTGSFVFVTLHVAPAILGQACLAFALIVSAIFLIQERRLKSKVMTANALSGPSLQILSQYNQRFVMVGFIALTLAVMSGTIWAVSQHQSLLVGDITQWSAYGAWIMLAVLLHLKLTVRISNHQASLATLYGAGAYYLLILLAVLGGNSFLHIYG